MADPAGMYGMLGMAVFALTGTALGEVLMAQMVGVPRHSRFHHLSGEGQDGQDGQQCAQQDEHEHLRFDRA